MPIDLVQVFHMAAVWGRLRGSQKRVEFEFCRPPARLRRGQMHAPAHPVLCESARQGDAVEPTLRACRRSRIEHMPIQSLAD